jgi:hypothetical protein
MPCKISKLDSLFILAGVELVDAWDACPYGCCVLGVSNSGESDPMMPGGSGRGPERMIFSRVCSWACWCLMECLSVDI